MTAYSETLGAECEKLVNSLETYRRAENKGFSIKYQFVLTNWYIFLKALFLAFIVGLFLLFALASRMKNQMNCCNSLQFFFERYSTKVTDGPLFVVTTIIHVCVWYKTDKEEKKYEGEAGEGKRVGSQRIAEIQLRKKLCSSQLIILKCLLNKNYALSIAVVKNHSLGCAEYN